MKVRQPRPVVPDLRQALANLAANRTLNGSPLHR